MMFPLDELSAIMTLEATNAKGLPSHSLHGHGAMEGHCQVSVGPQSVVMTTTTTSNPMQMKVVTSGPDDTPPKRFKGNDFIGKTWAMVNTGHPEIGWNESGRAILIGNAERLAEHVLPLYFRHSNYASWTRALNAHGFSKHGPWCWEHPLFVRGLPRPPTIRRKPQSSTTTVISACSSKRFSNDGDEDQLLHQVRMEHMKLLATQIQISMLEAELSAMSKETLRQRFDTVRMMHTHLQQVGGTSIAYATPDIQLSPEVVLIGPESMLIGEAPVEMNPKKTVVAQVEVATVKATPLPASFESLPPRPASFESLPPRPASFESLAPRPAQAFTPSVGAGSLGLSTLRPASQPPALQLASIAACLPHIPSDLLREVSFDQLPPQDAEQRQQVETAINWYFNQLDLASQAGENAAACSLPREKRICK